MPGLSGGEQKVLEQGRISFNFKPESK